MLCLCFSNYGLMPVNEHSARHSAPRLSSATSTSGLGLLGPASRRQPHALPPAALFAAARSSRVVFSAWSSHVMFSRCLQSRGLLLALFPSLPPAGVLELPEIILSSVTKVNLWVDWGPHLWLKACYVALSKDTCWVGSIFGAWPRVPALHSATGDFGFHVLTPALCPERITLIWYIRDTLAFDLSRSYSVYYLAEPHQS